MYLQVYFTLASLLICRYASKNGYKPKRTFLCFLIDENYKIILFTFGLALHRIGLSSCVWNSGGLVVLRHLEFRLGLRIPDPGEAPSQSSEAADSQHDPQDRDGKKKRQRRQRTHFTSQQLQVSGHTLPHSSCRLADTLHLSAVTG